MSDFRDAVKAMVDAELTCPHCGAQNAGPNSNGRTPSPTIERQQNGWYLCAVCAWSFNPHAKEERNG